MREIKFRAWDSDRKEMISDVMVGQGEVRLFKDGDFYKLWKQTEPMNYGSVMQSTGIKDINGKDIYEGDVVKRMCFSKECDLEHKGKVVYEDNWGKYGIDDGLRDYSYLAPVAYGKPGSKMTLACEVVGNIYENPEMDIIYKKNE